VVVPFEVTKPPGGLPASRLFYSQLVDWELYKEEMGNFGPERELETNSIERPPLGAVDYRHVFAGWIWAITNGR
jgi:hypothetical protein